MRAITLVAASAVAFTSSGYAQDCSSVAAATVAEIQAGEQQWDARAEALVRRAAGAACVKVMAEYAAEGRAEPSATEAGDYDDGDAQEVAPSVIVEAEAEAEDGKADWKFLGFDVNEAPGSPSQKPYTRKR